MKSKGKEKKENKKTFFSEPFGTLKRLIYNKKGKTSSRVTA